MNTVFYVLVAILVLGAGGYWYFFMRKEGSNKVDMSDGSGEGSAGPADMGGEKTAAPEGEAPGSKQGNQGDQGNQGGNDQPAA